MIENLFGILKARFRQLKVVEFSSVERICQFVMSCCVLYNLSIDGGDMMDMDAEDPERVAPAYRESDVEDAALRQFGELSSVWLVDVVQ